MDINTVIIFRRQMNPATPRANRMALRSKYHDSGTLLASTINLRTDH
jgi:hypothetical protein